MIPFCWDWSYMVGVLLCLIWHQHYALHFYTVSRCDFYCSQWNCDVSLCPTPNCLFNILSSTANWSLMVSKIAHTRCKMSGWWARFLFPGRMTLQCILTSLGQFIWTKRNIISEQGHFAEYIIQIQTRVKRLRLAGLFTSSATGRNMIALARPSSMVTPAWAH